MNTPHQLALNKAKIQLMSRPDSLFFTTICFSLEHIWDEHIPTACTNGKYIRFNPNFFMGLTPEERVFLLLHETLHVAYMHMLRLDTRNARKWNIAADYVINLQLVERGFKMPTCGLLDRQYTGMSTEQVYDLLPEVIHTKCDMDLEPHEGDPEQATQEIQDILVRAAIQSKMAGDKDGIIPGDIQIFLDRLLNPKLPWHRLLQKYLQAFTKNDYTFQKPNRRYFPKYHMPSLNGNSLINLAIAVDTSGSVSDTDFNVFVSEVHGILRVQKPEQITLIQFDTAIKSVTKIRSINELMRCQFSGRGGTSIAPVLKWAEANNPQLLLVFTDGGFQFYGAESKKDMLWLIHNNPTFTSPFGRVIHYEI